MRAEPAGFSFATNASRQPPFVPTLQVRRRAPGVVGKSEIDAVEPAMMASPAASTAIEFESSSFAPPRYVEYTIAVPEALSFVTNASLKPASGSWLPALL